VRFGVFELWRSILKRRGYYILNITLYSTDCPKCKILKQKLDEKNINYETCKDVNFMLSKGIKSVPILEVDDEIMNYLNAINWVKGI
jgi:glutaredoxin